MVKRLLAWMITVIMVVTMLPMTAFAEITSNEIVEVTGVQINSSAITAFYQGEKMILEVTIKPLDATNQKVVWKSANESVVSVNSETGEITGIKAGMTSISATTQDGGFKSTVVIRVLPSTEPIIPPKEPPAPPEPPTPPTPPTLPGWDLVWNDEFDDDSLDLTKWGFQEGGGGYGNNEQQNYRKENATVEDGKLIITAKKEKVGSNNYTSSKLWTQGKFSTCYGRIEASIKLPAGEGLWPAFWMMPSENKYGGWPNSGEIDIMEAKGRLIYQASGAIHYSDNGHKYQFGEYNFYNEWLGEGEKQESICDFHTYAIEWEQGEFRWYVDDVLYATKNSWNSTAAGAAYPGPFDQPFYIILNLAVGGNFDGNRVPADSDLPANMEVDYVRVYQESVEDPDSLAIVTSPNGSFKVNGNIISSGQTVITFRETIVEELIAGLTSSEGSTVKIFSSGTSIDENSFVTAQSKAGNEELVKGDFLAVLSKNGKVLNKYTIKGITDGLNQVTHTAKPAMEVPYAQTIDLSTLFDIDQNAGKASYSFTLGTSHTGLGTISGNLLTVTRVGTFYITLQTEETETYAEGTCDSNMLTVIGEPYTGTEAGEITSTIVTTGKVIAIAPVTVSGKTVEYACNTFNAAPQTGWQDGLVFNGLTEGMDYYFFARVKAAGSMEAGKASEGFKAQAVEILASTVANRAYFIASANNQVVQSTGTATALRANAASVTTNKSLFELSYGINSFEGFVGIRAWGENGNLVCADSWTGANDYSLNPRTAYKADFGSGEAFTIVPQGDGTVVLKAANGEKYVTVMSADGALKATGSTIGIGQKFIVVTADVPKQPAKLFVVGKVESNQVGLSWTAPANTFLTGYNLYRSTDGVDYTKVNTDSQIITNTYTDKSVVKGQTYYYQVVAANTVGESLPSNTVNETTPAGAIAKAPTDLQLTESNSSLLTLSWTKSEDATVTGYNIYSSISRYGVYDTKVNADMIDKDTISYTIDSSDMTTFYKVVAVNGNGESYPSNPVSREMNLFGPNVYIFSPNDLMTDIQEVSTGIFNKQEANQFGNERYALLFKKGAYDVNFNVGFYTHVAGLGKVPTDTKIQTMTVDARWLNPGHLNSGGNNATQNFWRTVENLQTNTTTTWAVSQAAPMRRLYVNGDLLLFDIDGWASGGFLADSVVTGVTRSSSQQQWLSRNTDWASWNGSNWNMVFVGAKNPPAGTWPATRFTTVEKTPIVQEKPFLYIDDDLSYQVFVPGIRKDTIGVSWGAGKENNGMGSGKSLSLDSFHVVKEGDSAKSMNDALNEGKNLLITPGVYHLNETIHVTKPNTVILGLGLASLIPDQGIVGMLIDDVAGVSVSGLIFDAGVESSPYLLKVGNEKTSNHANKENPILLSDLFFRIGGAGLAMADISIEINSNDVIGDHFWVWRADHGNGSGWDENVTTNGIVVNGDDVTIYGLMVEHFHEYQTLWNGNGGRMYFYQSETPYDPPTQADWMSPGVNPLIKDRNGYASYKVADTVTTHEAWGLGIYGVLTRTKEPVSLYSAVEVPDTDGVKIHNACTVMISRHKDGGEMTHVVNNLGAATGTPVSRQEVTDYCNGKIVTKVNVALKKKVNASSVTGNNAATGAVDGIFGASSRWESLYADPQWIMIDLGETYTLTELAIKWYSANSCPKNFKIQVSTDGTVWTDSEAADTDSRWLTAANVTNYQNTTANLQWKTTYTEALPKGRYIRMYGTTRNTVYGYSIEEFEVYGY